MSKDKTITIDNRKIPFREGQTIMDAALAANVYIPHLCYHPEFTPQGSCRICTVKVQGRHGAACTTPAVAGQEVLSNTDEIVTLRRILLQMLFVGGNHICPGCEKSGDCQLQAVAYEVGMLSPRFQHLSPRRPVDASHADVIIDFNRCILCELCVRASRDVDGKNVFAISGRGLETHLVVNAPSGKLSDTDFSIHDQAARVCPVGAILGKDRGYAVPIGQRRYDQQRISERLLKRGYDG